MARTRASKGNDTAKSAATTSTSTSTTTTTTTATETKYTLSSPSKSPPKIFILPIKATEEARIVSLLHPRYAKPTRYLVCPETGFYEFTRITAPKTTPRSWLIQSHHHHHHNHQDKDNNPTEPKSTGQNASFGTYVTNGAELFVATPIDPLFLILPTLIDPSTKSEKRRYISSDDHFDRVQGESPHLWEILRWGEGRVRSLLEARLGAVCETVEAGDERMFRFSEDKLLSEIIGKAKRMSSRPLPRSMEEKFVAKPLEAPVLGVKRDVATTISTSPNTSSAETPDDTPTSEVGSGISIPKIESRESESSISSTTDSGTSLAASETSTAATSVTPAEEEPQSTAEVQLLPAITASPEVISLQRLRTAFNFLCSSYVPPSLVTLLQTKLASETGVDFAPLDTYMSELSRLKQEAAAARSAGDYGRKRVLDDEEVAERAEKKRRKDEDDKRKKAGESRGVKNLKKVNTTGMKKMSDFFKKKT